VRPRVDLAALENRVRDLEEFRRDCAPALQFFDQMVPQGLEEALPEMLREFNHNRVLKDLVTGRRRLHQFRSVQLAGLTGALMAVTSIGGFVLAVLTALHVLH
jgi:hypothetical protein